MKHNSKIKSHYNKTKIDSTQLKESIWHGKWKWNIRNFLNKMRVMTRNKRKCARENYLSVPRWHGNVNNGEIKQKHLKKYVIISWYLWFCQNIQIFIILHIIFIHYEDYGHVIDVPAYHLILFNSAFSIECAS